MANSDFADLKMDVHMRHMDFSLKPNEGMTYDGARIYPTSHVSETIVQRIYK